MKYIIRPLLIAMLIGIVSDAVAQQVSRPRPGGIGSWRVLGVTQANRTAERDVIYVQGPYDYFRQIKFRVTDAPLEIMRMVVRYDDGGLPQNVETRFLIPEGGESRIIDLRGGRRKLKSVEFWYKTVGMFRGRADITLFGIK